MAGVLVTTGELHDWVREVESWHHRLMRVHRTFAFVDVSGFTALTELKGDEHAVEILSSFRALLRDICGRRGVRIVKWLGDGVMLVCVETAPLVATVLELHYTIDSGPSPGYMVSIRSGITSGDVILMEGDDYVGHCVNVAARLCDLGRGGEALAHPSVLDDMPRWGGGPDPPRCGAARSGEAGPRFEYRRVGQRRQPGQRSDLRTAALRGDGRGDRTRQKGQSDPVLFGRLSGHLEPAAGECRAGPRHHPSASLAEAPARTCRPSRGDVVPTCAPCTLARPAGHPLHPDPVPGDPPWWSS